MYKINVVNQQDLSLLLMATLFGNGSVFKAGGKISKKLSWHGSRLREGPARPTGIGPCHFANRGGVLQVPSAQVFRLAGSRKMGGQ